MVDEQWQHWEPLTKRFLQAPCDPARIMVTMFGKIPHTTPENPPQSVPAPTSAANTDYWQQVGRQLIRVHQVPRTQLFVPTEVPSGINPDSLEPVRTTYAQFQGQSASNPERFVDRWVGPTSHHELPQMWTGRSVFVIAKRGLKALSSPTKKPRLIAPPVPCPDQHVTIPGQSSHPVQQSPQVEVSSPTASIQTARHGPKVLRLEPEERAWLLRVHKNLGHPDVKKLQVFLRECKVSGAIVEAVEDLHCPTCHELQKPKIGRPAAIHPVREFGERVAIDGVTWTNAKGIQFFFYHMIDEGSNYHVAKVSSDKDAEAAMSAIESMWFSWAGPMVELFFDAGVEFNSTAFGNFLQSHGIRSRVIAKEAHFQLGRCERHGGILQEMLRKLDHESPIESPEQLQQALNHSCSAKNSLSRCRGYTPEIIVLGRSRRLPGSVTSDDLDSTHALAESETSEGEAFRASLALRERARRAFVQADNASSLRRAYLGRSRPDRGAYEHGDWVMYWREAKETDQDAGMVLLEY